jgi:fibronectin type III domain protein
VGADVNLFGHKVSGWYAVGGIAGIGVVVYLYKRSASSGSAATAAASSPTAIDPVTGLPYSEDSTVDPATGLTYLAEAQQYGSVSAAEAAVSGGYAATGETAAGEDELDSGYPTIYPSSGATVPTGTGYATNAQWAQAVTAGLTGLGYSSTDVAAALGLYFQGMPLGTGTDGVSYTSIVQAAVAEYGPPPVGTYQIVPEPTGTKPTPVPGGTGSTTAKPAAPHGLSAGNVTTTGVTLHWDATGSAASQKGESYAWRIYHGSDVVKSGTAARGDVGVSGLKSKTAYAFDVTASNSAGSSPASARVSFTTR